MAYGLISVFSMDLKLQLIQQKKIKCLEYADTKTTL